MAPKKIEPSTPDGDGRLLQRIAHTCAAGRVQAVQAVDVRLMQTDWRVGQHIVEFEQGGNRKAECGKALIGKLAADLGLRHGKRFSRSNLTRIRQCCLAYPKGAALLHFLGWSHVVELLKIADPLEREALRRELEATLREAGA